jgi:hypothetical protein
MKCKGSVENVFNGPEQAVGSICWTGNWFYLTDEYVELGWGVSMEVYCLDWFPTTTCEEKNSNIALYALSSFAMAGVFFFSWRKSRCFSRNKSKTNEATPLLVT